jgi:lysophospholipase L1-like esterase
MFPRTLRVFVVGVVAALALDEIVVRLFVPVRNVGPSFSEYDPVYGKSLKKNFSCTRITPEFRMSFTTNSLGHRGPEPAAPLERGILFLGDSFTEGYGVNDGEEFPALVREALRARYGQAAPAVINAGVGHVGNGRWLKFLRLEGKRYDPQVIVLQLSGNDFADNISDRLFTLSDVGTLMEHDPPPPGAFRHVQWFIEAVPGLSYSYLVGLIREAYYFMSVSQHTTGRDEAEEARINRLTFRIIEEIVRLCQQQQWPLAVVIVDFETDRLQEMKAILERHNVPHIVPPAKSERPDLYYTVDGHWNKDGHELVAFQVLEMLASLGIPKTELHATP